jgi:hypothetical protein
MLLFWRCEDDRYTSTQGDSFRFSVDSLKFDTVFTSLGSANKSFILFNPTEEPLVLRRIELGGGTRSKFRLNINGNVATKLEDVVVPAFDSLFVFVELRINPNGTSQPMIVQDSIVFETKLLQKNVQLQGWGQDIVPVEKAILKSQTWKAGKPYLITGFAYVDSGEVLTIEPGARIYFHNKASLYVKGALKATGTAALPIVFAGDRREEIYQSVPNQWQGILVFPGKAQSTFEHVEIRNANIGLQVGTIEDPGSAQVSLHNVKIKHMGYAGIFALKSKINASNTLVYNCGFYCVALLVGGDYQFNHMTIANQQAVISGRKTSSVVLSNFLRIKEGDKQKTYSGDMVRADWANSIIWGDLDSEVEFGGSSENTFNYKFDRCLLKLADSINVQNVPHFNAILKNIDPRFKKTSSFNFELDTLSPAQNKGFVKGAERITLDLKGDSRIYDNLPDLGAYERIEKKPLKK